MNPILKNVIAVVVGIFVGGLVNMGIIMISPYIAPLPEGVDPSDIESIKENIGSYSTLNLFMPILAHALGTFVGAFITTKLCAIKKIAFPLLIGFFFLFGGVQMARMIPAPSWMMWTDLLLAYIPMAWLGAKLGGVDKT